MKKLYLVLLLAASASWAQVSNPPIRSGASDPATCSVTPGLGENALFYNTTSKTFKYCSATNTWTAIGAGGGSSTATYITNADETATLPNSSHVTCNAGVTCPASVGGSITISALNVPWSTIAAPTSNVATNFGTFTWLWGGNDTTNGIKFNTVLNFLSSAGTGGIDSNMLYCDASATTKCAKLILSGITAGNTRNITVPNSASATVADTDCTGSGHILKVLSGIGTCGADSGGLPDTAGNGIVVRTAALTDTNRSMAATLPITVTNADGTAGNPNYACATCEVSGNKNAVSGYAGLDGSGKVAKTQTLATTVYTDQANTYTTGDQNFAAATGLEVPAGNTNPTGDGAVYYNNSAQAPGTGEHLGGSAVSQFVPFTRLICPTTLTNVTASSVLNPAATTETVFDLNCKINSGHLTAGKTLLVFVELQVVAPGASASTQVFRLKLCQVSGCGSGTVVNLYDPSSTDSAIAINTTRSAGIMFIIRCDTTGATGTVDVGLLTKAGSASSGSANAVTQPVTVATNVDEYLSVSYASGNSTTGNTAQERGLWVAELN